MEIRDINIGPQNSLSWLFICISIVLCCRIVYQQPDLPIDPNTDPVAQQIHACSMMGSDGRTTCVERVESLNSIGE